jgi:hypothetical protein
MVMFSFLATPHARQRSGSYRSIALDHLLPQSSFRGTVAAVILWWLLRRFDMSWSAQVLVSFHFVQ